MAADATGIGTILMDAGKSDQAQKRFQQALDVQLNSSLSPEAKEDAQLAHHYYLGRVALARNDLATAKSEAEQYLKGAEAKQNSTRIQQAHELAGTVALKEKNPDKAISELGKANQQDPYVVYLQAMANGVQEGNGKKAAELYRQAAESYTLPTLSYVLIRAKAKQQAGPQPTS
jgi:tetratricopeptide (TPR) repeat protein